MENLQKDESLISLKQVYVVLKKVGTKTIVEDNGCLEDIDIFQYNIAIVSDKKPRKAYYIGNQTVTENASTVEDELSKIKFRHYDFVENNYQIDFTSAKIDNYEAMTLQEFVNEYWFIDNLNLKNKFVKSFINNKTKVSIKQLYTFEKIFNDKNFKIEKKKQKDKQNHKQKKYNKSSGFVR